MSNLNHELSIEAIDIVIAAIKRKQEDERAAHYQQIGIETSKFYHAHGELYAVAKEELAESRDNDLDFTHPEIRGWF
jgi:hypothetical protein